MNKNTQNSLSKFLAQSGVASRRKVVELIEQGAIKVNNKVIKEPGYKLSADDVVTYNNKLVRVEEKIYLLLNKPTGYITSVSDEKGRKTVMDILKKNFKQRLYPVGRLDYETSGLLVITNDGHFAQQLAHPSYNMSKTYAVTLDRWLAFEDLDRIKAGLQLPDGRIEVDAASYMPPQARNHIKVALHSGRNRIVRRIFEHLGYTVKKLDRVGYAGLTKKDLRVGNWRYLTDQEIENLVSLKDINNKKTKV
jgi:23S rRNA pseudouridine2605 synthase